VFKRDLLRWAIFHAKSLATSRRWVTLLIGITFCSLAGTNSICADQGFYLGIQGAITNFKLTPKGTHNNIKATRDNSLTLFMRCQNYTKSQDMIFAPIATVRPKPPHISRTNKSASALFVILENSHR
jgi:hypothetical protein